HAAALVEGEVQWLFHHWLGGDEVHLQAGRRAEVLDRLGGRQRRRRHHHGAKVAKGLLQPLGALDVVGDVALAGRRGGEDDRGQGGQRQRRQERAANHEWFSGAGCLASLLPVPAFVEEIVAAERVRLYPWVNEEAAKRIRDDQTLHYYFYGETIVY